MNFRRPFLAGSMILLICGIAVLHAAPQYSISATNVTMPAHGGVASQFTISAIPVTGTIVLNCGYMGSLALGRLPVCPLAPQITYDVTAGGTLTGTVIFYPPGGPQPLSDPGAGIALGGMALLLLRCGRTARRSVRQLIMAAGSMVLCVEIGACANPGPSMPKGTFLYNITAVNHPATGNGPSFEAHTTVNVTVR